MASFVTDDDFSDFPRLPKSLVCDYPYLTYQQPPKLGLNSGWVSDLSSVILYCPHNFVLRSHIEPKHVSGVLRPIEPITIREGKWTCGRKEVFHWLEYPKVRSHFKKIPRINVVRKHELNPVHTTVDNLRKHYPGSSSVIWVSKE